MRVAMAFLQELFGLQEARAKLEAVAARFDADPEGMREDLAEELHVAVKAVTRAAEPLSRLGARDEGARSKRPRA
jgi:hypothetical protein